MISFSFDAEKVKAFLSSIVEKYQRTAGDEIADLMLDLQNEMKEEGKPVTYPIQWDSERQRRYVISKLRAEGNLPYKRTGKYQRGWRITRLANGYQLSNKHPAGAIGGTLRGTASGQALGGMSLTSWQSKIHRGRWKPILPTLLQKLADLPKRVVDRLKVSLND